MRTIASRAFGAFLATASLVLTGQALAARTPQDLMHNADTIEPAESLDGNYLAALVASASRDTDAAATYYAEALRDDPRNEDLLERAFIIFLANGSMDDAFRAAERMLARDPSSGLARLALGVRDLRKGQYVRARNELTSGGRTRVPDITATLLKAWSWAGSRNANRALQTVDQLKSERAFNLFRDYHAGLIAAVLGRKDEADKRLTAAYMAEKTTLRVVEAYARFKSGQGDNAAALEAYRAFDKAAPNLPMVRAAIAELEAGKKLAPLVSDAQEGASEALYGLGAAGGQEGDELAGMIYLRLALHLDPHRDMGLVTLGELLERTKQREAAIPVFERIKPDSPLYKNAQIKIALDYELTSKSEEAEKTLQALSAKAPDDEDVLTALANIYESRKKFAEAATIYTRILDKVKEPDASHWRLFYRRGVAYDQSKDWSKAEADLKKALDLAPDSQARERAVVLNYLGYSWIDRGLHLDEGFQMLKRAVELRPRDAYIIDSLGWAYYKLGRYEDAVRELEKSVDLKPSEATTNDHLGDAYWRVGRKLEAKFQWNHARDLTTDQDELKKILAKIENGLPDEPKPAAAEAEKPPVPPEAPAKNGG